MDFIRDLGELALGSRLRRLSDALMSDVLELYRRSDVAFEPRWFPLFRLLADRGTQNTGEAAAALGLSHAAISQMSRALLSRELMTSTRDPADERRRLLALTEAGLALVPRLEPLWADLARAVEDLQTCAGANLLAALDATEAAHARASLIDRVDRLRAATPVIERIVPGGDRPLTDALRAAFASINYDWLEEYFAVEAVDRAVLDHPESLLDRGGALLFARLGGEIVGCCALAPDPDQPDRAFELTKMGVRRSARGRGIGRKLVDAARALARDRGVERVYLMTNARLDAALAVYRAAGFEIVHRGCHPKYERCDLVLERALPRAPA